MISAFAVSTVTVVLKSRIENWLAQRGVVAALGADVIVSALPPDRITTGADERPQLNVFLYNLTPNTALRGGSRRSCFDLHYLLTAYGAGDAQADMLIGCAIHALQATPVIDQDAIRATLDMLAANHHSALPLAALDSAAASEWIDKLTLTPLFLSSEDFSRIFSALQARFRPSVAYRVTSVAIGSESSAQ